MPFDRFYVGTTPTIRGIIVDSDGNPLDLTGATVNLLYRPAAAATPVVSLAAFADPDQATNKGRVKLQLANPLMGSPGRWEAWWHALLSDSTVFESDVEPLVITNHDPVVDDPTVGPCTPWVDSDDIAALPSAPDEDVDYSEYAILASELLYQWSGRQFAGTCTRTVRPSRMRCECWGTGVGFRPAWDVFAGRWWSGSDTLYLDGCGRLSTIPLAGHVRAITGVWINGDEVPAFQYRVDFNRELVALKDADGNDYFWPACQDMRLGPLDPGAFTVTYTWGHNPPAAGKRAAARLALELWKADNGGKCALPTAVVRLVRQNVTIERQMIKDGTMGLASVDAFLAAYNPHQLRRPPAVWSPDQQRTPRRTA